MRRVRRTTGMFLTMMILGGVVSAPSPAVTTAPVAEREAAQAYADAALRFSRHAQLRAKEAWRLMGVMDPGRCLRTMGRIQRTKGIGQRRRERAALVATLALVTPIMRALQPPLDRFAAALEAVPTSDPALKSGRAAWRQQAVAGYVMYGRIPEDVCTRLRDWHAAGAPGLPLPELDLGWASGSLADGISFDPMEDDEPEFFGDERKLERAAVRLRVLGQGPRRSARFTGASAIGPYVGPLFGLVGVALLESGGLDD